MMKFCYPADFDYELINDVVVIYDLDQGNCTVTTDIQGVLKIIKNDIPDLTNKRLIYQDSEKIFDEIIINAQGRFVMFRSINERQRDEALNKINKAA